MPHLLAEMAEVEECQLVTLRMDSQLLGIPVERVRDVLKAARITRVPLAPPEVSGVMNLRGRIVTVLDVRTRLQLAPAAQAGPPMFIVVERKGEYFALKVDAIGDVLTVPVDHIEHKPSNLKAAWREIASGVYWLKNELLVVIDMDSFVAPLRPKQGGE